MSIELKDITEFTGVELGEDATIDDFKSAFNEKYVPADQHSKKVKEITSRAAHHITKAARDAGFELDKEEVEKVDLFELPNVIMSKASSTINELKENKSATEEEVSKKYQKELETWKSKYNDTKGLLEETSKGFEAFKSEVTTKERNRTIGGYKNKVMGSLNWSDNANDFVKKGFEATLNEKYKFDLSDENKPVVRDADGNLIQSKEKAGQPATYEEVIKNEFTALKDFQKVADSKKVPNFASKRVTTSQSSDNPRVAPRYRKNPI